VASQESDERRLQGQGRRRGYLQAWTDGAAIRTGRVHAEIGELSEPVKTQYGYHLIKVESRESKTFEEVKPELEKRVGPEMTQKAVADLEKQTPVVLDPDFFGPPAK